MTGLIVVVGFFVIAPRVSNLEERYDALTEQYKEAREEIKRKDKIIETQHNDILRLTREATRSGADTDGRVRWTAKNQ
jgi:Tfp pilus assembly protein PilN